MIVKAIKMKAIVTVKLPRNPSHNPRDKKKGICPLFEVDRIKFMEPRICTDITGSHHSFIAEGDSEKDIIKEVTYRFGHITRIEIIGE